ncbi:MAG: hypothetical protein II669_03240 [Elusimicrobia bacterium]|nr:hypothetical protein [Elusimicrobiota bacterium]
MKNKELKINELEDSFVKQTYGKAVKSDDKRRKFVNENFIIRIDGTTNTEYGGNIFAETIEIHSAIGYEKANAIGGKKFQTIVDKAIKKGGVITRLKINHKLTLTLYSR